MYKRQTQESELHNTFRPFISQEEPRYNDGDFAFFEYNRTRVYGKIQLVDDDTVTLQVRPDDAETDKELDIEIDKETFDKKIIHDVRNQYLYDPSRPLYRIQPQEEGDVYKRQVRIQSEKQKSLTTSCR